MPLGFERLNERTKRPNDLINFIKPLPGPKEEQARDFLERVAAICYPIMKANHIAVMSLEEHEPNPEFIGRNFNAGEVIQLVLKAPFTGQWVPFRHVQMVMMHELAHCKQMNHSKFFWKVRDQYSAELRALWTKGYTGEGLWGRGQTMLSGQYETNVLPESMQNIDRLCGGTFRSRGKKRKRGNEKPQLSYAERKQRRILKKFGAGGVALGEDEAARTSLESNKNIKGKPRVAGSARGRELRAAAALARFEQVKKEDVDIKPEESDDWFDSMTESDSEDNDTSEAAIDVDGKKMTDRKGRPLVSVCGAEDPADDDVQREMRELFDYGFTKEKVREDRAALSSMSASSKRIITFGDGEGATPALKTGTSAPKPSEKTSTTAVSTARPARSNNSSPSIACPICSLENESGALVCAACSHVLKPDAMPNYWSCDSLSCAGSAYLNSGDAGRCGLCGHIRT